MLGQRLGIDLLHIPSKGAAGNMLGLLQGDVFFTIENIPTFAALVKEGRLRLLAVSTAERSPNFPDVPTIQESDIENFDVFSWFGISAARSTRARPSTPWRRRSWANWPNLSCKPVSRTSG